MTKSFEKAVAEAGEPLAEMDETTRAAIQEGLAQARRGEFVPDEVIKALWERQSQQTKAATSSS